MKIFKLDETYSVVCEWKKTRQAFKHVATLMENGLEVDSTKICYLNRTWESYDFQSVLHRVIDKYFNKAEANLYKKIVDDEPKEDIFAALKMVCLAGEVMFQGKDVINFKKRMLKTVPGMDFPEDFDSLPAEEQEKRINGALEVL